MDASSSLKGLNHCGRGSLSPHWVVLIRDQRIWSPSYYRVTSGSVSFRTILRSSAIDPGGRSVFPQLKQCSDSHIEIALTEETHTTWLNRALTAGIAAMALIAGTSTYAAAAEIGCPLVHDGQPLESVGLFDGPPSDRVELMPQPGRFVINEGDEPSSRVLPYFTLGCTYRGSKDVITVVLPRHLRVCEFPHYPQVRCH
jgi:hypothetical protein